VGENNDYDAARYAGVLELVREKSDWDNTPEGIPDKKNFDQYRMIRMSETPKILMCISCKMELILQD